MKKSVTITFPASDLWSVTVTDLIKEKIEQGIYSVKIIVVRYMKDNYVSKEFVFKYDEINNSENLKQLHYNIFSCLLNYEGIKIKDIICFGKDIMYFEKDIIHFEIIFTPVDISL